MITGGLGFIGSNLKSELEGQFKIWEINEDIFNALTDTYEQLNTGNRVVFKAAVNESIESFERVLEFVESTIEEE